MVWGSIRIRLLLLLTAVFAVVSLIATLRAYERRAADIENTLRSLQDRAMLIAAQQGDAVRRSARFLTFAGMTLDLAALSHTPECPTKLQTYIDNDDYLANVFIADAQGKVICNPLDKPTTAAIPDREYFQLALASPDAVTGDPLTGRYSHRWVIPFAQRFTDAQGKVAGVIVVALDVNWVNKAFNQIAAANGIQLGLVTSRGTVLARQPDPEHWVGQDISHFPVFQKMLAMHELGAIEATSHAGEARIYAFAEFAQTRQDKIYLWISLPRNAATAKADQQFHDVLTLMLALVTASFLLAWLGGYRLIVRPLEKIVHVARRLAKGEFDARTGLAYSASEIGQLARAFDDMASQLASVDAVTGLLNLQSFEASLATALAAAGRQHQTMAVLRLQIKDFEQIEASHGPAQSNEVIKVVGQRISQSLMNAALVARVGHCDFAVAYPMEYDMLEATQFVEHLQTELAALPVLPGEQALHAELCAGLSFYPADGAAADELLQRAGLALSQAVQGGSARLRFYEHAMNERMKRRTQRLADLRQAVRDGQFELHYQPQVELATGQLLGFEALVRWRHPRDGWIPPLEFIPLAEESGLMIPLGNWILRRAVAQLQDWRAASPAAGALVVAVNISAAQFAAGDLLAELRQVLADSALPPTCLELEITESQLMSFQDRSEEVLRQISALGVRLAIDDFGTGYSSLSYLKHFVVDKLKVDKSFVDHIVSDASDAAIVEATVVMAHKLGLQVIAEGVETAEQAHCLRRFGCDQIQGYYYGRPLPADAALAFINQHRGLAPAPGMAAATT